MPSSTNRFSHLPKIILRALIAVVPAVLLVTLLVIHYGPKPLPPASPARSEVTPTEWPESLMQKPVELATRPVFPYSIVPGGVRNAKELQAASSDPLVAQHYSDFRIAQAHTIQLDHPVAMYVSYRRDDHVFWTRNRLVIPAGETLLTDGKSLARTRCANRLSPVAVKPVAASEPTTEELNEPTFLPPLMDGLFPGGETGFLPGLPATPAGPPSGPLAPLSAGGSVTPPVLPPILLPGGPHIPNTPAVKPPPPPPPPPVSTPEPGSLVLLLAGLAAILVLATLLRRL